MSSEDSIKRMLEAQDRAFSGSALLSTAAEHDLMARYASDRLQSVTSVEDMWREAQRAEALLTATGYRHMQQQVDLLNAGVNRSRQILEEFERYAMPNVLETQRVMDQMRLAERHQTLLDRFLPDTTVLSRAMESMRTPWLNVHDNMRSIAGFTGLQSLGNALHHLPAFDEGLSAALRVGLGDWRDPIAWTPDIFSDRDERRALYDRLGFDPALTDFPEEAFDQSIQIAGLESEPPPLLGEYLSSQDERDASPEGDLKRTNKAHNHLMRLETQLRHLIDQLMTRSYGRNWYKQRLPKGFYEEWQEKKRKALEHPGHRDLPLIAYADFMQYEAVICRRDNWREVFAPVFKRPESVRESFQRLHPLRNDTMHARPITQEDELLLWAEVHRLMQAVETGSAEL